MPHYFATMTTFEEASRIAPAPWAQSVETNGDPEWVALSPTGPYVLMEVCLSSVELAEALAIPDGAVA